jgi:hypothetical protein
MRCVKPRQAKAVGLGFDSDHLLEVFIVESMGPRGAQGTQSAATITTDDGTEGTNSGDEIERCKLAGATANDTILGIF